MKLIVIKILGLPLLITFMNSIFLLFYIEVYKNLELALVIFLMNVFICMDILIRPISRKKDEYNRIVVILSFVFLPLMLVSPYIEQRIIQELFSSFKIIQILYFIGVIIEILGGFLLITSRIELGRFGSTKVALEDQHKLIGHGLYKYIRNPMYLGILLLFLGYGIAFHGFISTILIDIFLLWIVLRRIQIEEKLLVEVFGEEYKEYMKETKRLIPYIY